MPGSRPGGFIESRRTSSMQTSSPPSAPGRARIEWMDALRGMAIILVIFDHAIRFTGQYAGTVPVAPGFLSDVVTPLRMPAMVFLSGMLLSASIAKGRAAYMEGKFRNILYPYLLWSAVYVTLFIAAQPVTGGDHDVSEYGRILYDPPGHLWFLYYLFFYYALMLALHRVPRLPLAAAALLLSVLSADIPMMPRFWFLFAFFALGDLAARRSDLWLGLLKRRGWVAAAALAAAGLVIGAVEGVDLRYQLASVPSVVGGIVLLILVAEHLCRTRASAALRFIGRNSLPFYILHWLMIALAAVLLRRLLADVPEEAGSWVMLALCFAVGLAGSLLAVWTVGAFRLSWLFSLPKWRDRRRLAAAE